ncbi:hypothetical protein ACIBTP_30295 [Streptomyces avidinii]|uniref:hypothetical protein n=1 Tax=Streptomyces avidinii TaxID=1895 RepID=UPI00379EECB7
MAEVPLTGAERCVADRHARRITEALRKAAPADHEALRTALAGLDYPAARIHRLPGGDSTRVDLRLMGGLAVLEITGTGPTATVTLETEDPAIPAGPFHRTFVSPDAQVTTTSELSVVTQEPPSSGLPESAGPGLRTP